MASLVKELSSKKLKDFPDVIKGAAKEHLEPSVVKSRFEKWSTDYASKYIRTGSGKPIFQVLTGVFVISYIISWPREYAHYKAEQEAKLTGGAAHH